MDSTFCINSDNITINKYVNPSEYSLETKTARNLTDNRLDFHRKKINESLLKTDKTKGALSSTTKEYISTTYPNLQRVAGKSLYPDSNFVSVDIINYCEASDSTLSTDLCSSIYNTFSNNPLIAPSRERMDDYNKCIVSNKFMTDSPSDDINNPSCSDKRDNAETFARYLPLAINYCGNNTITTDPKTKVVTTKPNIISPECQTYYNKIGTNITNTMSKNYTNPVAGSKDNFTNKETFNDCPFSGEDSDENMDNNNIFIFLLFIIFVLMVITMASTYTSYKTKNNISDINNNIMPKSAPM
jgi:hypothetical protein